MEAPSAGTTGLGVSVVGAPNAATGDSNAVVKTVGPSNEAAPAAEAPAAAPEQINDIKPGTAPATTTATADSNKKKKAPKADLSDESSSKKKKKKGLGKLNPF
jgi:outer membrane protein assembly factor BamD